MLKEKKAPKPDSEQAFLVGLPLKSTAIFQIMPRVTSLCDDKTPGHVERLVVFMPWIAQCRQFSVTGWMLKCSTSSSLYEPSQTLAHLPRVKCGWLGLKLKLRKDVDVPMNSKTTCPKTRWPPYPEVFQACISGLLEEYPNDWVGYSDCSPLQSWRAGLLRKQYGVFVVEKIVLSKAFEL